jgi:streptomycin 6-kinase
LPVVDDDVRRRLARRFGPAVEPWLAGLPARIAALRDRWGLALDAVIPWGSMSVVLRCRTADRRAAILKLAPDLPRLAGEAAALRHWAGRHAPAVLAADLDLGGLLLEEIAPGTTLREGGRYPSIDDLAALLAGLHRDAPPAHPFPPLARRVADLFASWRRPRERGRLAALVPAALLARGRRLALRLDRTSPRRALLHGDLTPVNVLDGGDRRGLVAIDPAPCLGDPAFDAIDLTLWRAPTLEAIRGRASALGPAIGADPDRLLAWCAAFAAMVAMDVAELPGHAEGEVATLLDLAGRVTQE